MPPTDHNIPSLVIKGKSDESDIIEGFRRIVNSFDDVKAKSNSVNSDMHRMVVTVDGLVEKFTNLGTKGVSSILNLAASAPAVAPALADMEVNTVRLSHTLGTALEPAFNKAAELFGDFVTWVEDNEDTINKWAENAVEAVDKVINKVKEWHEEGGLVGVGLGIAGTTIREVGGAAISAGENIRLGLTTAGLTAPILFDFLYKILSESDSKSTVMNSPDGDG